MSFFGKKVKNVFKNAIFPENFKGGILYCKPLPPYPPELTYGFKPLTIINFEINSNFVLLHFVACLVGVYRTTSKTSFNVLKYVTCSVESEINF